MEEVQIGGNAFVNGTLLRGRSVLRFCALHYALTVDDVEAIVEEVRRVGERCLACSFRNSPWGEEAALLPLSPPLRWSLSANHSRVSCML